MKIDQILLKENAPILTPQQAMQLFVHAEQGAKLYATQNKNLLGRAIDAGKSAMGATADAAKNAWSQADAYDNRKWKEVDKNTAVQKAQDAMARDPATASQTQQQNQQNQQTQQQTQQRIEPTIQQQTQQPPSARKQVANALVDLASSLESGKDLQSIVPDIEALIKDMKDNPNEYLKEGIMQTLGNFLKNVSKDRLLAAWKKQGSRMDLPFIYDFMMKNVGSEQLVKYAFDKLNLSKEFDSITNAINRSGLAKNKGFAAQDLFQKGVLYPSSKTTTNEDLRAWFGKGKKGGAGGGGWDRYNTKGERIGKCGERKPGEGKPKCLSKEKAASLRAQGGKKAIASAVKKKRREDPNPERQGGAKMVSNKTKNLKESIDRLKQIYFGLSKDLIQSKKPEEKLLIQRQIIQLQQLAKKYGINLEKDSLQTYVENFECPHCHGPMFSENQLTEEAKKDACYHKVKSRYKVWPSAYASGALVKCRKAGASNWGNKSKK